MIAEHPGGCPREELCFQWQEMKWVSKHLSLRLRLRHNPVAFLKVVYLSRVICSDIFRVDLALKDIMSL